MRRRTRRWSRSRPPGGLSPRQPRCSPRRGLELRDGHPELAPQVVSTGLAHLLVPLRGADALARAAPSAAALRDLLDPLGATVLYLAVCDRSGGWARARGFLRDGDAVLEDPATGSAAGPLLAYLHDRSGLDAVEITQGVQMGRPSTITATWAGDRPRVAGDVVVVAEG